MTESFIIARLTSVKQGKFDKTVEWLTVRREGEKLFVTAAPDTTGKARSFQVDLTFGNLSNTLYGEQLAE